MFVSFRRHSGDEHRVRTVLESVSPRDNALLDPLPCFIKVNITYKCN